MNNSLVQDGEGTLLGDRVKVGIVGPHGSGNRLVRRVVDYCYPEAECGVRSFPIGTLSNPPGRNWDPRYLLRNNFIPDFVLVTMREMSPWCMVREQRPGAVSVEAAIELWKEAYRQIYRSLGPFWERPDVALIRYRDFMEHGVGRVASQISDLVGKVPAPGAEFEPILDGDLKYRGQVTEQEIQYLSTEEWLQLIISVCEPYTEKEKIDVDIVNKVL